MKKAIVIGATSGMGRELAKILAENNYMVGLTGRRDQLLLQKLAALRPRQVSLRDFGGHDAGARYGDFERY